MGEPKDRHYINLTMRFRPYPRKYSIFGGAFSGYYFLIFETGKSHLAEQQKKEYVFVLTKYFYESPF